MDENVERSYHCPKCNNLTLGWDGHRKVLSCSYLDFVAMKSCDFQISIPERETPPNDSEVMVILEKYRRDTGN